MCWRGCSLPSHLWTGIGAVGVAAGVTAASFACEAYVGVFANAGGTSHILAAYQTAQATTKSAMTHTHTGMDERASA